MNCDELITLSRVDFVQFSRTYEWKILSVDQ